MSLALALLLSLPVAAGVSTLQANGSCADQCLTRAQFEAAMAALGQKADSAGPDLPHHPSDVLSMIGTTFEADQQAYMASHGDRVPMAQADLNDWSGDVIRFVGAYSEKMKALNMPPGKEKDKELHAADEKLSSLNKEFAEDVKNGLGQTPLIQATNKVIAQLKGQKPSPPSPGSGGSDPPWPQAFSPATDAVGDASKALDSGDPSGARQAADQALAFDPASKDALDLRGQAEFALKDYAAAARDARQALSIDPEDKTAKAVLGLSHDRTGGAGSEAAGQAQSAAAGQQSGSLASAGGAATTAAFLGAASPGGRAPSASDISAQLGLRDYQAALAAAGRAIQANPGDAKNYFYSSVARMKLGDQEGALKDAVAGLAVDPKSTALLDAKAEALNRLGRYRDALAAASAALELNPKDPHAYFNRGVALFGMKDREAAVLSLRQAAAIDPQFAAVAERAANAPSDADLSLLLPDMGGAGAQPSAPARKAGRFGVVAATSLLGGLLIALGLFQFFMEPVKSAFTRLTRRGTPASFEDRVAISPLAQDGSPGLLRGQYQVLRPIGQGGMGVVYEGRDVSLERRVAIKRMRDELKRDPRERQRFLSEAKLVAALHHPNIVDIYAIVEQGDEVYLVFEHINGRTVHELICAKGRLAFDEALGVLRAVAAALDFAHARGIIHRDLKPSNVMVDEEGRPRVMDFGIARAAKDALTRQSALMTNTVVGTPPYMAPEQEQGVVRKESDVYALAVCFYEMLAGRLPFAGTGAGMLLNKVNHSFAPLSAVAAGLPKGLDAVMAMGLDPDPAKRFGSAKQLVDALDGLRLTRP